VGLADGPLDVRAVPGNHETMLIEPYVTSTAEQLQLAMDEVFQYDREPMRSAEGLTARIPLAKGHAQP
jgi:hypothetical protein